MEVTPQVPREKLWRAVMQSPERFHIPVKLVRFTIIYSSVWAPGVWPSIHIWSITWNIGNVLNHFYSALGSFCVHFLKPDQLKCTIRGSQSTFGNAARSQGFANPFFPSPRRTNAASQHFCQPFHSHLISQPLCLPPIIFSPCTYNCWCIPKQMHTCRKSWHLLFPSCHKVK